MLELKCTRLRKNQPNKKIPNKQTNKQNKSKNVPATKEK